jgi:predicted amidophosphoribosyltransferase
VLFKEDGEEQKKIFSKLCGEAFKASALKFDFVTRALGSKELTPSAGNRIIPLAKSIAEVTGAQYIPKLLKKNKPVRPLKTIYRKAERALELEGVYEAQQGYNLDNKKILIVDDITTSGTTLTAIAKAIKTTYKNVSVCSFCLAHTKSFDWDFVMTNPDIWIQQYKDMLNQS